MIISVIMLSCVRSVVAHLRAFVVAVQRHATGTGAIVIRVGRIAAGVVQQRKLFVERAQ